MVVRHYQTRTREVPPRGSCTIQADHGYKRLPAFLRHASAGRVTETNDETQRRAPFSPQDLAFIHATDRWPSQILTVLVRLELKPVVHLPPPDSVTLFQDRRHKIGESCISPTAFHAPLHRRYADSAEVIESNMAVSNWERCGHVPNRCSTVLYLQVLSTIVECAFLRGPTVSA